MTSPPIQARASVHDGPASNWVRSTTFTPCRKVKSMRLEDMKGSLYVLPLSRHRGDLLRQQRRLRAMHLACTQREHGPQTLVGFYAHAQAVLQRPVVLVDGEDGHVRHTSRRQRAQLVRQVEHGRSVDRHHADDVGEPDAQRDELIHHLDKREGPGAADGRQLTLLASERTRTPDTALVPTPDRVAVDVTADGERHDAGVEGDARGVEAHVATAADVDADATRHGFEDQRMHLALT